MFEGSIELLLALVFVGVFVAYGRESLRKNRKSYYRGACLLSGLSLVVAGLLFLELVTPSLNQWWVRVLRTIISGYLPAALYMAVMYMGLLDKTHNLYGPMTSIRSELSILGLILYLPHTLLYTGLSAPYGLMQWVTGDLDLFVQMMTWTGLVNTILLLVLGLSSLPKIRKKMKPIRWLKVQKWAYLFYGSCFLHYMTLSYRGRHYERCLVYLMIYGYYGYKKVKMIYKARVTSLA